MTRGVDFGGSARTRAPIIEVGGQRYPLKMLKLLQKQRQRT